MLKIIQTKKAGKNVSGKNKKWMLKWIAGTEFLIRFFLSSHYLTGTGNLTHMCNNPQNHTADVDAA